MILVFTASPQSILYKHTLSASIIHPLQMHTICNDNQLPTKTHYLYPRPTLYQYILSASTIHHVSIHPSVSMIHLLPIHTICIYNLSSTNTLYLHPQSIFYQFTLSLGLVLSLSIPPYQGSPFTLLLSPTQFLDISFIILRQEDLWLFFSKQNLLRMHF